MAGNSAEFGDFLPVVRFWVENRTKIVPREGDLTAAQEALRGPSRQAASAAPGPVGDQIVRQSAFSLTTTPGVVSGRGCPDDVLMAGGLIWRREYRRLSSVLDRRGCFRHEPPCRTDDGEQYERDEEHRPAGHWGDGFCVHDGLARHRRFGEL